MKPRNLSIDLTKSFLVVTMVAFHCFNYFIGSDHIFLSLINFVTGAFPFLTGFMTSYLYPALYQGEKRRIQKRLIIRGLKLLLVFTILNTSAHLVFSKNYNNAEFGLGIFYADFFSVYLLGDKRVAAFEILLPIAYTLIISGVIIKVWNHALFYGILSVTLVCICALERNVPYNFYYTIVGLSGMGIGSLTTENSLHLNRVTIKLIVIAAMSIYLVTTIAGNGNVFSYIGGIGSILYCANSAATSLPKKWNFLYFIAILGQYSLISYLVQIIILQLLIRNTDVIPIKHISIWIIIAITNILVIICCYGIRALREKSRTINFLYKSLFA